MSGPEPFDPNPSFAAETAGSILLLVMCCLVAIGIVIAIEGVSALLFSSGGE